MENYFLKKLTLLCILILSLFFNLGNTQQLAFPTAYGGGAYTSGGRGGNVYKVTNLLDDGSVGSFRWAVTQARPATIIFDVSGTIELTSSLIVQGDDLTVAGQTAPQGGITITSNDKNIRFAISRFNSVENHIWRYIRIRAQYQGNNEYINFLQYGGNNTDDYTRNIILDHLSISGAQYMAYGIRGEGTENVTLQHIMFGENAKTALFGDTDDLFSKDFTFRNNTIYHSTHRVPNTSAQNVDVYNNVVYDWKNRLTVIKNGTKINHFNNYYYRGTRTNLGYLTTEGSGTFWEINGITTTSTNPVEIYSKNNVIQDLYDGTQNTDDRSIWMHHSGELIDGTTVTSNLGQKYLADDSYFRDTPMNYVGRIPSTFLTAEQAKTSVPNDSGAYKYLKDDGTVGVFRDALDTEYHSNIINDNATDFNYDGGVNDPANSTLFANFVASISTTPINLRPVDFYDTNDYIPQAYLDNRGIIGNSTIHNEIQPSGYTLLEEYMNQVDNTEDIDNSNNSLLAFPTAVGAGAYTTGGRGGKVCHVNTLNWDTAVVYDAATDSYSGGFYNMFYELDIPAKEIVFTVSGTIVVPSYTVLNFASKNNEGNITVSGQTSNIVFSTDYFQIQNAKNLIWRYTSFYKRDDQAPGSDVVWVNSSENDITENVIFDHCSFYYGGDECFSVTSSNGEVNNITVQWSLMAASSKGSIIGAYTGESNATTAYCSYQDISYRFPNMLGYGSNSQQDVYNIFVGNYTSRLIRTTGDANFNVQNIYVQANRADYGRHRMQYQSTAPCQLYAGGTIITGVQDTPSYPEFDDVWTTFSGSDIGANLPIPNDARASSAFALVGKAGTIYDTDQVKTEVLPYTGNTKRLANDGSVIADEYALDTFYRDLGVNKQSTSLQTRYPSVQFPEPNLASPLISTLKDGIPDIWRAANMNGESHCDIVPGSHYTWLETFHNQIEINNQTLSIPEVTPQNRFPIGYKYQMYNILGQLIIEGKIEEGTWYKLKEGYKGFYILKIENGIVWKTIF